MFSHEVFKKEGFIHVTRVIKKFRASNFLHTFWHTIILFLSGKAIELLHNVLWRSATFQGFSIFLSYYNSNFCQKFKLSHFCWSWSLRQTIIFFSEQSHQEWIRCGRRPNSMNLSKVEFALRRSRSSNWLNRDLERVVEFTTHTFSVEHIILVYDRSQRDRQSFDSHILNYL